MLPTTKRSPPTPPLTWHPDDADGMADRLCDWRWEVFEALKPGATLGLSHGFLLCHLNSVGDRFPAANNVVMVAPKGSDPFPLIS